LFFERYYLNSKSATQDVFVRPFDFPILVPKNNVVVLSTAKAASRRRSPVDAEPISRSLFLKDTGSGAAFQVFSRDFRRFLEKTSKFFRRRAATLRRSPALYLAFFRLTPRR